MNRPTDRFTPEGFIDIICRNNPVGVAEKLTNAGFPVPGNFYMKPEDLSAHIRENLMALYRFDVLYDNALIYVRIFRNRYGYSILAGETGNALINSMQMPQGPLSDEEIDLLFTRNQYDPTFTPPLAVGDAGRRASLVRDDIETRDPLEQPLNPLPR